MKTAFSCTFDTIIRGSLCSGIDQFLTLVVFVLILFVMNLFQGKIVTVLFPPIFAFLFYQFFKSPKSLGRGHGPLVHLTLCPVTVVQPRIDVIWGEGVEVRVVPRVPSVGRCLKIREWKRHFQCTLDTIIRGNLCSGIDQFPTLFFFHLLFLMNFFQGNIFLFRLSCFLFFSFFFFFFSFSFFPFFFTRRSYRGAMAPLCPPP